MVIRSRMTGTSSQSARAKMKSQAVTEKVNVST